MPQTLRIFWADWRRRLPYRRYGDLDDRPRRLKAQGWFCFTLLCGSGYLVWLGHQSWHLWQFQAGLFWGAEALALALLFLLGANVWRRRFHRPEGLSQSSSPPVDILVTCCGEPLEVIRTTLVAVSRIDYQPRQVYVLDDAGSAAVAQLAAKLGFTYHSRVQEGLARQDSKGGNLNFGLSRSASPFILVLDADQVPQPDVITRLIGFAELPRVAYVQSRQSFWLPDHDPFYNRDAVFYESLQLANDQVNAVISCGSGVIYRRQALEEMGGFATWNLVEDLTTSYELLSRGWRGIYFPYALSCGLAPENFRGVCRQRFQWCLDAMRLFFWDNPLFKAGLRFPQRLHFLIMMVAYLFSGLVMPLFYILPLYSYTTGISFLAAPEWHYGVVRGLYLAVTILTFRYLFADNDPLKQFKMLCGLFPVYAAGIVAAIWYYPGHKPAYRVNNAVRSRPAWVWPYLVPQMILMALHLILPFAALHYDWAAPRLIAANALFSVFTIWVLGETIILGLSQPHWSAATDPRLVYGFET